MNCRNCDAPLTQTILDLGEAPPSNAYLDAEDLGSPEAYYPLRLKVCERCWLVQLEDFAGAEQLFDDDYAYFSSVSTSWLEHAARYAEMIIERLELDDESMVIEVAANDGYMLRNFVERGIPCLGIEPTASTAAAAEDLAIPILREFFGEALASRLDAESRGADLIIANNVYAHVPDINDFTRGLKRALNPGGTITLEFPHLMRLLDQAQFDTVYHEHYSYLSLAVVCSAFARHGLSVYDVEPLTTHGGSLRVYGGHAEAGRERSAAVEGVLEDERRRGLQNLAAYGDLQSSADRIKHDLLEFLFDARRGGKRIAAYGAAAKGNTLLNYAGVTPDLIPYVCDAASSKQGRFLPGSRIPIVSPSVLFERQPETLLILPWNIAAEVVSDCSGVPGWSCEFIIAVPELRRV